MKLKVAFFYQMMLNTWSDNRHSIDSLLIQNVKKPILKQQIGNIRVSWPNNYNIIGISATWYHSVTMVTTIIAGASRTYKLKIFNYIPSAYYYDLYEIKLYWRKDLNG